MPRPTATTDIRLPEDPDAPIRATPTGDVQLVADLEALRLGLRRRVVSCPGELTHRPAFGAGLPLFTERAATLGAQARLASVVRESVLLDPRVESATVAVGVDADGRVEVDLAVQPRRSLADERLLLTVSG